TARYVTARYVTARYVTARYVTARYVIVVPLRKIISLSAQQSLSDRCSPCVAGSFRPSISGMITDAGGKQK
ncbi:MAG: hypothetical protein ACYC4N_08890, partial [Pirellulaceae bacterium]